MPYHRILWAGGSRRDKFDADRRANGQRLAHRREAAGLLIEAKGHDGVRVLIAGQQVVARGVDAEPAGRFAARGGITDPAERASRSRRPQIA